MYYECTFAKGSRYAYNYKVDRTLPWMRMQAGGGNNVKYDGDTLETKLNDAKETVKITAIDGGM